LGCNVGDCRANLLAAVRLLGSHAGINVTKVSSVYVTEPVGYKDQPNFLNIAIEVSTTLSPADLHSACRAIEDRLGGRHGRVPQGPRTIDLDILLYEQVEIREKNLVIPHPHMLERAFVLVPLAEIAPRAKLPQGGTVAEAVSNLVDSHMVESAGLLEGFEEE
jgi:2-amino-4-hydroxy-6-hydroxymethyldihydropteridine diphosphokinase